MADSKPISERLKEVADPESLLVGMFEKAPIPLQIFHADGRSLLVNPALARAFGAGPPPEYVVFEDEILLRQGFVDSIRRAFEGETITLPPAWYDVHELSAFDTSALQCKRSGIQATLMPLFDRNNVVQHVLVWGKDVTSELELRGRDERQRLAFAAARVIGLDTNLTKGTLQVSDNAGELLGLRPDTPFATMDDLFALVHAEDRAAIEAAERDRSDSESKVETQFRLVRPDDGTTMWFERRGRVWYDDVAQDHWRRGILFDITERVAREAVLGASQEALRRTEDQLRQAQKLEAIGRLAGGIAHDFNNLLSVIISYSQLLLKDTRPPGHVREDVTAILRAGEQAADLTRQLLAVSRQQMLAPRVLDLNETVESTLVMLRRVLGENVELNVVVPAEPTYVLADGGQMAQVVMNLAINARDAMPEGGKVTIEIQHVMVDDAYAKAHLVAPGPHIMLSVSDNGVGMDEETQSRIFEPFFTTKATGKGTGLGLATVFGIVQQSNGSISVHSEPGQGTTFKILFPHAKRRPDSVYADMLTSATLNGEETVLLVEDQLEVLKVAHDILEHYGYRVLAANDPADALSICESHHGPIHLILTDIVMPQMNGRELADHVRAKRPDMRVLFMSGYTEDAILQRDIFASKFAYLQKPFTPESLAGSVREAIAAPIAHHAS